MLNQSILVGRIVREPEVRETENGVKISNITLAVPRSYKNVNGEYDVLWRGVAEKTAEYCKKGDLIGVRGHIQTRQVEYPDETRHNVVEVIAEKVTFLSNRKPEEKAGDE